jgi:transposase
MTDDLEELKNRLVVGRKRDGRGVYDEAAKAELVALCMQPGASVSRLARECGVNANQVSRWLRERGQGRRRVAGASEMAEPAPTAFVAVPVLPEPPTAATRDEVAAISISVQARLPNGVSVDLGGIEPRRLGEVIEALGRVRCSVSTKG